MLLTTTNGVEGSVISEYCGLVFGEVVSGINFMNDFSASITDIVGGRSNVYESELIAARSQALNEMIGRAAAVGADAVIGIKIDYETIGSSNAMMMINASGTAVKLG